MKNWLIYVAVLCSIFLIASCTEKSDVNPDLQNITIRSGTSFGECAGYCHKELVINSTNITFTQKANNGSSDKNIELRMAPQAWDRLLERVNLGKIQSLPQTIGCPDCADGGAEWIEISSSDFYKRVTFEYGDTILEINDLVIELRKLRNDIELD